jgi:hypothetical protein
MKILVKTLFDCSNTGTVGNFRQDRLPFHDHTHTLISDRDSWNRSRNQQRNWETLLQVLGLRCQLEMVTDCVVQHGVWQFEFEVENAEIFGPAGALDLLIQDCDGVPMLHIANEREVSTAVLITQGQNQNIWFQSLNT